MRTTLLAKSRRRGRELTLAQHLSDTSKAAAALFRAGSRWGGAFLRFFRLCADDHSSFALHLQIAALLHDLGKANEGFLDAITRPGFKTQPFRHEHLSALVIAHPAVREWLARDSRVDVDLLVAAVLSHHLKAGRDGDYKFMFTMTAASTRLFLDDRQLHETWAQIASIAGLPIPAFRLPTHYSESDPAWEDAWQWFEESAKRRFPRELRTDSRRLAMCMALKSAVIAADAVASAAFREELSIETWIEEVAHRAALGPSSIAEDILEPRQREIERTRPFTPHRFQDGATNLGPRALLLAGCGMGKTIAAWRWAEAVAREHPIGRIIFLYPTRGTATEGFRDYVGHAPEGTASLVHGTSRYELQGMLENPPSSLKNKAIAPDESEARLFALGLWSKRYFSATVDQFLSFIEHGYGGICLLPALADAAVVFDEIHSYDPRMWNALITFLQRFDVPVLCMTATLSPSRRAELQDGAGLRVYPNDAERKELQDLESAERHPRYRFETVADEDAAFVRAIAAHQQGQRVLWVVNTVKRCQRLVRRLEAAAPGVLAYHSRFKLEDRQERHRATIDAFRAPEAGEPAPAIAVTTQVCEMSLDLDADVLITEHAPISSLVQRFGRANRHLRRGENFRATILTYAPETHAPYDRDEFHAASRFLHELDGRDVSQRGLAEGLAAYAPAARAAAGQTRFTDGGYFATPGSLRETDDADSSVILDADLTRFRELTAQRAATDGLRLSVPRRFARDPQLPDLPTWLRVADAARYSPLLGFNVDEPT